LSLTVAEGERLVLLGASGAGKTTALKTINRLVEPDSGRVLVFGREARDWDPVALRREIGWAIQEVGLLPHLGVAENVELVPRLLGWPARRRADRAREMLALVGLDADAVAPLAPAQLSGGQRQRVGLARALAAQPRLRVLDEPFGALDPLTRRALQTEFLALQARLGTSVVLVTHDVPEALRLADRLAVMRDGRCLQLATPAALRAQPAPGFVAEMLAAALP
jgi:osmoprotectant transport system ATP-binding protein